MSSKRPVWLIGAGRRAREGMLPVLDAVRDAFELRGILARSSRTLELGGRSREVRALTDLRQEDLEGEPLVCLAVTKDAIPEVLQHLARFDLRAVDLLLDTPVVRFRHFRHARWTDSFRSAWVAEDCATLPWIETVLESGIGEPRELTLDRSAYAYHGVATAKAILGERAVRSARRRRLANGLRERVLDFGSGKLARIVEPRDYSVGSVTIRGTRGTVSDAPDRELRIVPVLEDGLVHAIRIGDVETRLTPEESRLTAGDPEGATIIARQESMKRVGLARLFRAIAAGRGAYPVREGLDDMVVDYHLEKFGRYFANPFTSVRSPLGRVLLGGLSRVTGR